MVKRVTLNLGGGLDELHEACATLAKCHSPVKEDESLAAPEREELCRIARAEPCVGSGEPALDIMMDFLSGPAFAVKAMLPNCRTSPMPRAGIRRRAPTGLSGASAYVVRCWKVPDLRGHG